MLDTSGSNVNIQIKGSIRLIIKLKLFTTICLFGHVDSVLKVQYKFVQIRQYQPNVNSARYTEEKKLIGAR